MYLSLFHYHSRPTPVQPLWLAIGSACLSECRTTFLCKPLFSFSPSLGQELVLASISLAPCLNSWIRSRSFPFNIQVSLSLTKTSAAIESGSLWFSLGDHSSLIRSLSLSHDHLVPAAADLPKTEYISPIKAICWDASLRATVNWISSGKPPVISFIHSSQCLLIFRRESCSLAWHMTSLIFKFQFPKIWISKFQ